MFILLTRDREKMRDKDGWWISWKQYEEKEPVPDLEAPTLVLIKYLLSEEEPPMDGYDIERDVYAIQAVLNGDRECTCAQRVKCSVHDSKTRIRRRERIKKHANTNTANEHL